jgi:phosphoribosylformimino-5-aminoimidazole carboxamide ribotide isomerase
MSITVFPAIDLHQGHCVRLKQGRLDAETSYSSDPVAMARHWVSLGAEWLHVVNLDGAFETASDNVQIAGRIATGVEVPTQLGGGLRSLADIDEALELGVHRVILGTMALRRPDLVGQAIRLFGADRVMVGIDARGGRVAVRGWQEESETRALTLALSMRAEGVQWVVYTDISRDGMLTGVNLAETRQIAEGTGMRVIASGGVSSLDDILAVRALEPSGVEGVIVGQALYAGAMALPDALALASCPV